MNGASQAAKCVECGAAFATENMIRYGGSYVCAACKPLFMQKLAEGVKVGKALRYAGFGIRFGAQLLDGLIIGSVLVVVIVAMILSGTASSSTPEAMTGMIGLVQLGAAALSLFYQVILIGKYGGTPGKLILGLKVVTADGDRVTYLRALARHFATILSQLILFIGYIMILFDDEKRALHDRICDTRVVYK